MECSFCGYEISRGTGKLFIQKTGKILYFCSRKCEKNLLKLGRVPRDFKWTASGSKKKKVMKA